MTETEAIFGSAMHKRLLLTTLKLHNVITVQVDFAGSGDSGSLEDLFAYDNNHNRIELDAINITWPEEVGEWDEANNTWTVDAKLTTQSLYKVISDVTYKALENSQLDWYNNDGGQGYFLIDLTRAPPEITLMVGVNYTTTEDHTFSYNETEE